MIKDQSFSFKFVRREDAWLLFRKKP